MKIKQNKIVLVVVLLLGVAICGFLFNGSQSINKRCEEVGKAFLEENKNQVSGGDIKFFYSKRLNTCIKQQIDETGNSYSLCDVERNYIKKEMKDSICGIVFHCDKNGIDSIILEKVEEYGGKVAFEDIVSYMDNGEGGEPKIIKASDRKYSKEECKSFFDKKKEEIK